MAINLYSFDVSSHLPGGDLVSWIIFTKWGSTKERLVRDIHTNQ